jgi:hypothetical protein
MRFDDGFDNGQSEPDAGDARFAVAAAELAEYCPLASGGQAGAVVGDDDLDAGVECVR